MLNLTLFFKVLAQDHVHSDGTVHRVREGRRRIIDPVIGGTSGIAGATVGVISPGIGGVLDRLIGGVGDIGIGGRGWIGGGVCRRRGEEPAYDRDGTIEWCSIRYNYCNDPRATCRLGRGRRGACCRRRRKFTLSYDVAVIQWITSCHKKSFDHA